MELTEILEQTKSSVIISDAFTKADQVLNRMDFKNIAVSISGGADSDIMMDICEKIKPHGVRYVWFDTGLEYQATKDHIKYLEDRYGVCVCVERAKVPIPMSNKIYGQPFLSKYVSEQYGRLQKYGFDWQDRSFEEDCKLFPKCTSAIKWFHNKYGDGKHKYSTFNIDAFPYLKEFTLENPPTFKISNLCCKYAKKDVSKDFIKRENIDLMCVGIRKSEGGIRSMKYKNCFSVSKKGAAEYRPVFWFRHSDRKEYEELFDIKHSDCYEVYGFTRTGCACCPYSRNIDSELEKLAQYEPKLYKACNYVFGDSYAYTRKFREFQKAEKLLAN